MISRRLVISLAVVCGFAAVVILGLDRPAPVAPVFARPSAPTTPYMPLGNQLSSTFYCAGAVLEGDGRSAEIVVANPTESAITGQLTAFTPDGGALPVPLDVAARGRDVIALDDVVGTAATAVGVIVELERTGATVEQRASAPTGVSISPCGNDASTQWYFADGTSVDGVTYSILLTNPYPDSAVVDISLVTASGLTNPTELQGYVVPPRSIGTVDISGSFARDEEQLSIAVESRRGRVIAAKSQTFNGGRRLGYTVSLGSPAVGDQWFFADGESGTGIDERYSIFNPTSEAIDVDVVFLPIADAPDLAPVTVTVESEDTVLVDAATVEGMPAGVHSVSVRTFSSASIVVERALTRPAGQVVATSVVLGSRFASPSWWLPTGVPVATPGALVVQNATNLDGTFTVSSLGPGGLAPVPGLTDVALGAGGVVALDLTAADAVGKTVLVTSPDLQLIVEQRYPRGDEPGLGGALAVPE
ncbi:MAG: DUF5719 family protein [Acidimicrobiia bacterium]